MTRFRVSLPCLVPMVMQMAISEDPGVRQCMSLYLYKPLGVPLLWFRRLGCRQVYDFFRAIMQGLDET